MAPPQFDPDSYAWSMAEHAAQDIVDGLRRLNPRSPFYVPPGAILARGYDLDDLDGEYLSMLELFKAARAVGSPMPCFTFADGTQALINYLPLLFPENYPLAELRVFSTWLDPFGDPFLYRTVSPRMHDAHAPVSERYGLVRKLVERFADAGFKWGLRLVPPEGVLKELPKALARFLATRFGFTRQSEAERGRWERASISGSPAYGLSVTVETQGANVHVDASPAFFLTWTFFGGPTMSAGYGGYQTHGSLRPGLYVFRGRTTAQPGGIVEAHATFGIPPTTKCPMTLF